MSLPDFLGYRHAAWDTPWWVNPHRRDGRYNVRLTSPAQYVCLHPLGPVAELLRHLGRAVVADIDTVRHRLWAMRVSGDGLVRVTFDTAGSYGVTAEDLVGEDYGPTQQLARRLAADGAHGLVAPSGALPGTEVAVLFGPRVLAPYLASPLDPEDEIPTGHAAEGLVPVEVVDHVRWKGDPHPALEEWRRTGISPTFTDPPVPR